MKLTLDFTLLIKVRAKSNDRFSSFYIIFFQSSTTIYFKHVGGRTMRSQVVYQIQCVIDVHEGPKFQVPFRNSFRLFFSF